MFVQRLIRRLRRRCAALEDHCASLRAQSPTWRMAREIVAEVVAECVPVAPLEVADSTRSVRDVVQIIERLVARDELEVLARDDHWGIRIYHVKVLRQYDEVRVRVVVLDQIKIV